MSAARVEPMRASGGRPGGRLGLGLRGVGRELAWGFCLMVLGGGWVRLGAEVSRPNFVLVLGEGHGWSSTSVQMDDAVAGSRSGVVRTPNLERLAREGMRFARFYAPSPRCTPSRASLLTGKSPAQLHMTFVGEGRKESGTDPNGRVVAPTALAELPAGEVTLAEWLRAGGYATAHFGKWHLGRVSPVEHGFEETDGPNSNGGPENVENPHPKQLVRMTESGMEFMERAVRSGRPFFLQLSHYASRQGGDASGEALAAVKGWGGGLNGREAAEAAATLDLDLAFGRLLGKIDALGLAGNTFVIFTTDHGTPGRNGSLTGGKGTVFEGGLRVPLIIRGPGVGAGTCCRERAAGEDFFPTVVQLAGVGGVLPSGLEGGSLEPLLRNGGRGEVHRPREEFVVHFPHYDKDPAGPASALWLGDYKLVRYYETGVRRLYDVRLDAGERRDLAGELPGKVAELDRRLTEYLTAVGAQMPQANPAYDPGKPTQFKRGGKRKAGG